MKRLLALVLIGFLLTPQPAYSVIKAGSKCAKAGATSNVNGKKFTCVKKSGKLVWNSGSILLKAGICPATSATDKKEISKARAATLVSMTEADSVFCAEKLGWIWRIEQRDDEFFALTRDYRLDRVTVVVKNGLVTSSLVG